MKKVANGALRAVSLFSELIIQQPYSLTANGKTFLQFNSGSDDINRFRIFITDCNLDILALSVL